MLSIGIAYIGVDLACLEISDNCTYYEVQALINNRTELIGFAWLWVVMLIISDFGMGIKERSANVVIQKRYVYPSLWLFFSYRCFDCLYIEL